MAWYRAGTAQVTTGSATVLGTGTQWVSKVKIGEGFYGPDNRLYEIDNVSSDNSLTLTKPYAGASDPAAIYDIIPTQSFMRTLATQVADLISLYSAVPDNVADAEAAATNALAHANLAAAKALDAETAKSFAQFARDEAQDAQAGAEASETAAAGSASTASTKATEAAESASAALASQNAAAGSATAAADSASSASTSAGTATTKAGEASTSATAAAGSASDALASKNAAATSESNAAGSASTASTKAGEATTSASNAATSAGTATVKAAEAADSAADALQYRDETQAIADTIEAGAVTSVAGRTGDVLLTKADVGLANVANTAPADLPVSTATATALAAKASLGGAVFTGEVRVSPASGNPAFVLNKPSASGYNVLSAKTAGVTRWEMYLGDNTGSFNLSRFSATGAWQDTPLAINPDTGGASMKTLTTSGNINALGLTLGSNGMSCGGNANFGGYVGLDIPQGDASFWASGQVHFNAQYEAYLQAYHQPGSEAGVRFIVGTASYREFRFDSNGNGRCPGSWTSLSDARLKTNRKVITDALAKVAKLQGLTYDREDLVSDVKPGVPRQAGLLAQEVRKVLPEAVTEGGTPEGWDSPRLELSYPALIPLLVEAIKELNTEVADLRARMEVA